MLNVRGYYAVKTLEISTSQKVALPKHSDQKGYSINSSII